MKKIPSLLLVLLYLTLARPLPAQPPYPYLAQLESSAPEPSAETEDNCILTSSTLINLKELCTQEEEIINIFGPTVILQDNTEIKEENIAYKTKKSKIIYRLTDKLLVIFMNNNGPDDCDCLFNYKVIITSLPIDTGTQKPTQLKIHIIEAGLLGQKDLDFTGLYGIPHTYKAEAGDSDELFGQKLLIKEYAPDPETLDVWRFYLKNNKICAISFSRKE